MSELDDLRARVDRGEAELAEVRAKAESAETLAGFADRDASDIKSSHAGIVRSLNALRETQLEQGRVLADHNHVLAEHSQAHGKTLAGIEQILTRLDTLGEDR
jgi:multidrug efflux pump subunit AcrA (membrane-fusion protein)